MLKLMDLLTEGVHDSGIFKAVFLAGGPGSGKTYVASQLFGIPSRVNLSPYGLKMVNQDTELETLLKKYNFTPELDKMPMDIFRQLTDPTYKDYSGLRGYAKNLSKERLKLYNQGRLGVIVDGTGASLKVMEKNIKEFRDKGYDVQMLFVETSKEVAVTRNKARPERSLMTKIVERTWESVQGNKEAYKKLFGERFAEVNTDNLKMEDVAKKLD